MNTMVITPLSTDTMSTSAILSGEGTPHQVIVLAAEGDTWGISGPTFVVLYIVLIAAALIGVMLSRRGIRTEPGHKPAAGWDADPYAVAFLNEGPGLAVTAALSALHVDGLITAEGRAVRAVGGHDATRRPWLEQAVVAAATTPVTRRELGSRPGVLGALDELRTGLMARGLLLDDDQVRRMRRWGWVMLAVFALGLTRFTSGLAGGKAVGLLVLLLVVAGFAAVRLFRKVPRLSSLADRELQRLRKDHYHLSPGMKPDWVANGALAAGMGVALFGAGALWAADPAFADEIVARAAVGSASGSSSGCGGGCGGSSGVTCGGGGDSGGGSSCGGGGGGCGG